MGGLREFENLISQEIRLFANFVRYLSQAKAVYRRKKVFYLNKIPLVINDPNLNRLNERYISKQKFLSRYYACVASLYHHYVNHQIKMKTMNANIDNVLLLEAGRGSLSQLSLSLKQSPHNDIIAQ